MKIKKIIFSSVATIALAASLSAGATYALFTAEDSVNIAITSGKLKIDAEVKNFHTYSGVYNSSTGLYDSVKTSENVETLTSGRFLNGGEAKLVNGNSIELNAITPMDKVTFDLHFANHSNIAFQYRTTFICNIEKGAFLFDGLKIQVGNDVQKEYISSSDWFYFDPEVDTKIAPISVSIELPQEAGNAYQEKACEFSFVIEAIQGNANNADVPTFYTPVSTTAELKAALANPSVKAVKLMDNIILDDEALINRDIIILGNDKTLTFSDTPVAPQGKKLAQGSSKNNVLKIEGSSKKLNVVLSNLTIIVGKSALEVLHTDVLMTKVHIVGNDESLTLLKVENSSLFLNEASVTTLNDVVPENLLVLAVGDTVVENAQKDSVVFEQFSEEETYVDVVGLTNQINDQYNFFSSLYKNLTNTLTTVGVDTSEVVAIDQAVSSFYANFNEPLVATYVANCLAKLAVASATLKGEVALIKVNALALVDYLLGDEIVVSQVEALASVFDIDLSAISDDVVLEALREQLLLDNIRDLINNAVSNHDIIALLATLPVFVDGVAELVVLESVIASYLLKDGIELAPFRDGKDVEAMQAKVDAILVDIPTFATTSNSHVLASLNSINDVLTRANGFVSTKTKLVTDEKTLTSANKAGNIIVLQNDIALTTKLNLAAGVVFDGNGFKLTFGVAASYDPSVIMLANGNNIAVKRVHIYNTAETKLNILQWYGSKSIANSAGVVEGYVEDVTITNANTVGCKAGLKLYGVSGGAVKVTINRLHTRNTDWSGLYVESYSTANVIGQGSHRLSTNTSTSWHFADMSINSSASNAYLTVVDGLDYIKAGTTSKPVFISYDSLDYAAQNFHCVSLYLWVKQYIDYLSVEINFDLLTAKTSSEFTSLAKDTLAYKFKVNANIAISSNTSVNHDVTITVNAGFTLSNVHNLKLQDGVKVTILLEAGASLAGTLPDNIEIIQL